MNGFDDDNVPGWLLEAFDGRTTLPHGPLELFPVPIDGEITGGRATVPKNGRAVSYRVNVACAEPMADALRFYQEFLPLSGYVIFGHGQIKAPRRFLRGRANPSELLLVRVPPYVGTVLLTPRQDGIGTLIEVDVADSLHPCPHRAFDLSNPRSHSNIRWLHLED